MSTEELACSILCSLGVAVLQRTGPKRYAAVGKLPPFYHSMFPPGGNDEPCVVPWNHSPMLEFFLDEAEIFFEEDGKGALSSGVWQEDGKTDSDSAMLAVAAVYDNAQVLLIRMLQEDYRERAGILRKAREQLLENRELSHNLNIFREKSRVDSLTKIWNKATFWDLLHDEIKRSRTLVYPLSLLMLDIDDFKKVNDTYGHLTGDLVLQALGAQLLKTLRRNDIVARFGGEEFVVLIPHESLSSAENIAEKVRRKIQTMRKVDIPPITVSVGCATYEAGETAEHFLERADQALYDAKKSGKNAVRSR